MIPEQISSSRLTFGIPTLNRSDFVKKLVERCLSQTESPYEIIVSDDESDDDTVAQLQSIHHPALRILAQIPRLGMIANWNACLAACQSEWFMLLSDDDMVSADFVACFEETLAAAPEADIVLMRGRIINKLTGEVNDNPPPLLRAGYVDFVRDILPAWLTYDFAIPFASMIFRTETLRRFGGFTSAFPYASDVATGFPIAIRGKCAFYPEAKVDCIIHEGMATRTYSAPALVEDVVNLTAFVVDEVRKVHPGEPELTRIIEQASRIYLRKIFGYVMVTSARRGVSKWKLLCAWAAYADKLPRFGLDPLSIGAVLVPQGLIQIVGWPYRKYAAWKRIKNAAR
jgi:glycosyltransferase involved in cell wall biosynthesis